MAFVRGKTPRWKRWMARLFGKRFGDSGQVPVWGYWWRGAFYIFGRKPR